MSDKEIRIRKQNLAKGRNNNKHSKQGNIGQN